MLDLSYKKWMLSLMALVFLWSANALSSDQNSFDFDDLEVSIKTLLSKKADYDGKEVIISGYLLHGRSIYLARNIESANNIKFGSKAVFIDPKYSVMLKPYDGCLIGLDGTFKKIYKDRDLFFLTDISNVRRLGMFYYAAQGLMKKNGIEGEPKCLGKALIELMATPKAPQ